ncbi:Glycosyl transferase, family 2 [Caldibacillus thermoamylovorans]|uniref:Glycosyl transferase, family 2 n=1 Tax=Caldibacillus thermoamylovorans TaxID=35841 RepID=A0A090IY81_9BACI|nr:glycosyltransferase family 2 protein [Caldibacillus thermoamylovorans]CEE03056.1 Glycosyl transferase, family 2 [Caldibacillus thermoamylovorans]
MLVKVSVLIPTYNAEQFIRPLLSKLENQKLPEGVAMEIILVDSSSTDRTKGIVKEQFPNVQFHTIPNKEFNHGGTRNMLADLATGEFLLYMTQDAIPFDDKLIMFLLENFQDENVLIACGRQIPKEDANPLEKYARSFNYPDKRIIKDKSKISELGIKTFFNSNVCSMYRATLFRGDEFHGFPNDVILNEDIILSYYVIMKGYKVIYDNRAIVYHSHNYSIKQQFKRNFDIGMAFNESEFMLENVSNEKEGIKLVLGQLNYLIKNGYITQVPRCIVESGIKFIGYKLGRRHHLFSEKTKRKLSAYMK